jgi:threonine synthase
MENLGWIGKIRPHMVAVQSSGCAPIIKAWDEGRAASDPWPHAATIAAGLRVPKAYADYLILEILRKSQGTAIAVTDDEIMDAVRAWATEEGLFAAPEGAAALAAYRRLFASGFFKPEHKVVLFNTGSGLKYVDVVAAAEKKAPQSRAIGGIIGPY